MPQPGLKGPYLLSQGTIDQEVTRTLPGVYVLGRSSDSKFNIEYVGRSDSDIRARLKQWVGSKYAEFEYEYYPSAEAAFEKECLLWHYFGGPEGGLDNENHPTPPADTNWQCPRC